MTLTLPDRFKLLEGAATQAVPRLPNGVQAGNVPVTWKVRAGPTGRYEVTVTSSAGSAQTLRLEIRQPIF